MIVGVVVIINNLTYGWCYKYTDGYIFSCMVIDYYHYYHLFIFLLDFPI